jgi:hypothetical protein
MTRYAKEPHARPLPEETLDRVVSFLEGPVNRGAERVMKSRLFLTPLALGWTVYCRSYLALRDGKPSRLWRSVQSDIEGAQ